MFFFSLNICQWHCPFVEGCYECEMPPTWRIQMTFVWKAPVQTISLRLRIFSMFQKKNITKNFMFKICFRPHRTQKIYSLTTKKFFPLGLPRRPVLEKKMSKILMFKMCFRPHRTQKYIPQKKFFFSLKGIGLCFYFEVPRTVRRPRES